MNYSDLPNTSGIYLIKFNKRGYIGSSKHIRQRIREHIYKLKKGNYCNTKLQNSYNKYGIENLKINVLLTCSENELIHYENWFINHSKIDCSLNIKEAATGGFKRGQESVNSKLTEKNVLEIIKLLNEDFLNFVQISKLFDIDKSRISSICRGSSWNYLNHLIDDDIRCRVGKCSLRKYNKIIAEIKNNNSIINISKKYKVSQTTISNWIKQNHLRNTVNNKIAYNFKISHIDCNDIKMLYNEKNYTISDIAKIKNCSKSMICLILNNKSHRYDL